MSGSIIPLQRQLTEDTQRSRKFSGLPLATVADPPGDTLKKAINNQKEKNYGPK
jgi:hypothetical protein